MALKLTAIVLYLGVLLALGIVASRRMNNVRDYFAADKKLSFFAVAFSARATGESAWLLLGLTGMGAAVGFKAFWVVLGEVLGVAGGWWMARRFRRLTERYDSLTVPDYLESRFRDESQRIRMVSASALVIFVTIYVSAQIDATGTAFNSFLGWNYYVGALVGFGVVMVYIVSGGFLAVVWSDVFQGTLMFVGLVALPIVGLIHVGGWDNVSQGLAAQEPGLLSIWGPGGYSPLGVVGCIGLVLIGLGFLGSPQIFVRFLALRAEREIPRGAFVALTWTLLADSGAVFIGLIGRHLFVGPGASFDTVLGSGAQNVLPMLVDAVLPAILIGLMIAVVLSAIMSTVDSLLVVASSALIRDFYQKVRHPELSDSALVGIGRKATALLALAALALAFSVAMLSPTRTIFWFVIFGWSGIAATFCPTMILSLYWRGLTARGALVGMIVGFFGVPFFKFVAPNLPAVGAFFAAIEELPPSFFFGGLAAIVVSLSDSAGKARLSASANEELDHAAAKDASAA